MNRKSEKSSDITCLIEDIGNIKFFRLQIFAETISRYIEIRLHRRDWLTIFCLIMIIIPGGEITIGELGKRVMRSKKHMTQLINSMLKRGLVARYHSDKDRRNVWIRITDRGLQYVDHVVNDMYQIDKEMISIINAQEVRMLIKLTRKLRRGLLENQGINP